MKSRRSLAGLLGLIWAFKSTSKAVGNFFSKNRESSRMNYYFTASGCMSERIRHRYEKTNRHAHSRQFGG